MTAATDSGVIRLPGAATRKVQQKYNRAATAARQKLREQTAWPGEYLSPGQRKAISRAEVLWGITQTPAILIVTAIFSTLDEPVRRKVLEALAPGVALGRNAHIQAFEAVRATLLTLEERFDLEFALNRLSEMEC